MINWGYPMMNAQQRLMQMEGALKTYVVTNIEEANATQVDINGTPTFFFNSATNEIYMKKVNLQTGRADFCIFQRVEKPLIKENVPMGINNHEKDFQALNDKLDGLKSVLEKLVVPKVETVEPKGVKNAK